MRTPRWRLATASTTVAHLGNIAFKTGKKLH